MNLNEKKKREKLVAGINCFRKILTKINSKILQYKNTQTLQQLIRKKKRTVVFK